MKRLSTLSVVALTLSLAIGGAFAQSTSPAGTTPASGTAPGLGTVPSSGTAPASGTAPPASARTATPTAAADTTEKKALSKDCSARADQQGLHGAARKKFRSACKAGRA